ncbi:MAG: LytTR family DNA-binding domain-containing protein [Chitinophagaceae bacterium]
MHDQPIIKCLIIDDEPPARDIIRRYAEQVSSLEIIGEYGNAIQAFGALQQHSIDLLFLDIQMPQLTGTDFIKTLSNPPKVIFTTAFPEYAVEGYELDAVDYLVKPIRFERFLKAINKTFSTTLSKQAVIAPVVEEKKEESFVYFRADRKMVKVMLGDILYIESMKDYIKIVTKQGVVITKQSISSVEAMLPEKEFVRVHRSYIVSLNKIKSFTTELMEVEKTEIPIGKLYRNEVLKMIG